MDSGEPEMDFTASLEPVVIIDDSSNGSLYKEDDEEESKMFALKCAIQNRIGPEVSLIPVQRPPIKLKMYTKFHSKSAIPENSKLQHKVIQKSSQRNIRLMKDKTVIVENHNTSSKRLSLPLEKCPVCKQFFRRMKTHLQKHDIQQNLDDHLTCPFCTRTFNTNSNLSIHMRIHTGDKPYKCGVCSKGFAQSCNLINHKRIHTGEKPFKCPHCDRAFTQSGNLDNHVRLHTDEKPFQCHFCDKAFTQSGNLSSHIRNNHKFLGNTIEEDEFDKMIS